MDDQPINLDFLESVTRERLDASGIWWNIFPNHEKRRANSCRSAIAIRDRLGSGENGGVPLWVEMKSELGTLVGGPDRKPIHYAAHTRANRSFDRESICRSLGLDPGAFTLEEHTKNQEAYFGVVNPLNADAILKAFVESGGSDIHQLFDETLLIEEGYPATVTTNVGNHYWGMEVAPKDLIAAVRRFFPNVRVGNISVIEDTWLGRNLKHADKTREDWQRFPPPSGPKIGILTGNSPESGLRLWDDLLKIYRLPYANTADVLMPDTLIQSLPAMGLSMELVARRDAVWAEMGKNVRQMLDAGCRLITVACNTTIHYKPEIDALCKPYGAEFVSIADACVDAIKLKYGEKTKGLDVGLIGIGPVIDLKGGYSGYAGPLAAAGINAKGYDGTTLAFKVKNIGNEEKKIQSATEQFRKFVSEQMSGESVIVLSLTEISLLYRQHIQTAAKRKPAGPERVFIDPLRELAKFITAKYISRGLQESALCGFPADFGLESRVKEMLLRAEEREERVNTNGGRPTGQAAAG